MRRSALYATSAMCVAACVATQFHDGQFTCDFHGDALCPPALVCASDNVCRASASAPADEAGIADAGRDAEETAADADAEAGAPRVPFGTPKLLTSLNTSSDDNSPRVLANELTVYFQSTRAGGADLYVARRAIVTDPFGAATQVPGVNTSFGETDPMPSPDELTLFYTSMRPSGLDASAPKLWVSTRASASANFANPALILGVESPKDDGQPFLRADGQELWLTSNRQGGGSKIYRAPGSGTSFANPTAVDELNTPAVQWKPYLTIDSLTVYFSSTRSDGGAKGSHDIWTAHRASLSEPFSAPENVAELNTVSNEQMGSISPDGARIYFASDRSGGQGSYDIYVAER